MPVRKKSRNIALFLCGREYSMEKQGLSNVDKHLMEDKATIPSKNQACELSGQCRSTFLMAFSPDGNRIASAHGDHTVRVTMLATGACTHILRGHPRSPWCIAFHPCRNDLLASGCLGGQVRIWDLRGGGSELWSTPNSTVIASLTFHPTDQLLVIATHNELFFWDWTQTEPFTSSKTSGDAERVRWVKFDPLGQYLLTGIANSNVDSNEDNLRGAQVNFSSESGTSDNGEHSELQDRYRQLVNQINTSQSQRINEVYPLGSAVRAAMNARPPQVQTFGGQCQVLTPPVNAEIDIVEPRSPVHHDHEDGRGSFAARVTSITSLALANARRYAAHVTEQSARMAMQDDERQVIRIRNEHAVDTTDNDDSVSPEPIPGPSFSPTESGLSNIVGPPELLSAEAPITSNFTNISPPAPVRPRMRILRPVRPPDPPQRSRHQVDSPVPSSRAARGLTMLLENLERRTDSSSRSPDIPTIRTTPSPGVSLLSARRQSTANASDRADTHSLQGTSTASSSVRVLPVPPVSNSQYLNELTDSSTDRRQQSATLSPSILRCQLATAQSSESSNRTQGLSTPVACTSSCSFCNNAPSSTFNNAHLSSASESLGNAPSSSSLSIGISRNPESQQSELARRLQSLGTLVQSETPSGNQPPVTAEQARNSSTSGNGTNRAGPTETSSSLSQVSSPQSLGSFIVSMSPHLSSILSEHRGRTNILNARNDVRFQTQLHVSPTSPPLPELPGDDALDIPPPHPWNNPLNSIGQQYRENQGRRRTHISSTSPRFPQQSHDFILGIPSSVERAEERRENDDTQHRWSERLNQIRQQVRQNRERRRQGLRGSYGPTPCSRLQFMRDRIADRRRRLREHFSDFRRQRGSANSSQSSVQESPSDEGMSPDEEPWLDLTRNVRPSSPLRMQQIRSQIYQREHERRSWHALERRQLHPHYAVSILDDTVNRSDHGLQAAINRAIAGAYVSSGEMAVATNIVNLTHRVQRWDFTRDNIPDISQSNVNIIVPHCKLHNDSSCDISADGHYLATFVPIHRGFPDDTVLAVYSLLPESKGECLYTKSFGPNAISASISPLSNYVLVGLASKKLAWVFTPKQMVAQVFKLNKPKAGEDSMDHICDLMHPCDVDIRSNVSVNATRWLPRVGDGLVYGTTRGDLHICRPGYVEDPKQSDTATSGAPGTLQRDLMHMLGIHGRTSTATQTIQRVRRSAATQTDQSHSSAQRP